METHQCLIEAQMTTLVNNQHQMKNHPNIKERAGHDIDQKPQCMTSQPAPLHPNQVVHLAQTHHQNHISRSIGHIPHQLEIKDTMEDMTNQADIGHTLHMSTHHTSTSPSNTHVKI